MAERADPTDKTYKGKYISNLIKRYEWPNNFIKDKIVVDIPTGVGWGASLLSGYKELYCIDISSEAIRKGSGLYPNLNFIVGNMGNIPLTNESIEVVLCLEGYEHITEENQLLFLKEAYRVLKSEGLLLITTPIINEGEKGSGNIYHLHEPTLLELYSNIIKLFYIKSIETFIGPDSYEVRCVLIK